MTRMTRIFKAALYIPAYHTGGKKNPRHPCHPCLKDYLHAEGEPCSSATLVNYHFALSFIRSYSIAANMNAPTDLGSFSITGSPI